MIRLSRTVFVWLCGGWAAAASSGAAVPLDPGQAYPAAIAGWTDAVRSAQSVAAARLQTSLAAAVKAGAHGFTIAPGDYRFTGTESALLLRGLSDFTIEASGATVWISPRQKALEIEDCRRVVIRGLSIDCDPLPFVQARIVKIDPAAKTLTAEVLPGYPLPVGGFVQRTGSVKALFFSADGAKMSNPALDWLAGAHLRSGRQFELSFVGNRVFASGVNVRPGDLLALPNRDQSHTVVSGGSEGLVYDGVTIYASASFALVEHGGKGDNLYRNCRVVRRPGTNRALACNADVFHSLAVAHGPTLDGCEFSFAGDDFINIHGYFDVVLGRRADGRTLILHQYSDPFAAGAELVTYDLESMAAAGRFLAGSVEVTAQGREAAGIAEDLRTEMNRRGIVLRDFVRPAILAVALQPQREIVRGTFIALPECSGSRAVVRNCYLHDNISRGALIGGTDTLIENNRIERTGTAGLVIGSERYWLEARPASHLRAIDNRLIDCGVSLSAVGRGAAFPAAISLLTSGPHFFPRPGYVASEVELRGNTIIRPAAGGIFVYGLRGGKISDNRIERAESGAVAGTGESLGLGNIDYAIDLEGTLDVAVARNSVIGGNAASRGSLRIRPFAEVAGVVPALATGPSTSK